MGKLSFKGYMDREDSIENKEYPIEFHVILVDEDGIDMDEDTAKILKYNKRELILRKREEK